MAAPSRPPVARPPADRRGQSGLAARLLAPLVLGTLLGACGEPEAEAKAAAKPAVPALTGDPAQVRVVAARSGLDLPSDAGIVDVVDDKQAYRFRYVTQQSRLSAQGHCDAQLQVSGYQRFQSWREAKGEPLRTWGARFERGDDVAVVRVRQGNDQRIVEIELWKDGQAPPAR